MTAKFVEMSKKYGVGLIEIDLLYKAEKASAEKRGIPPENVDYAAWLTLQIAVNSKYGKKTEQSEGNLSGRGEPADLEGFFIGFGEYRDKKAEMVKFIERYVKENGKSKAQQMGYIKTDGVTVIPLDYREKVFGKENTKKGTPLNEADVNTEMKLMGVFRRIDSEDPFVFATLETANTSVANSWYKSLKFPEHLFVPLKTNGNIKETELGFKVTASTAEGKVTKFTIDKNPHFDVYKAFMEAIGPLLTPWSWEDGDENHEVNPLYQHFLDSFKAGKNGKPAFDRMLFVKGVVDSIRPEWKSFKGTPAYLCNENDVVQRIKVYLPDGFEKMFGEGSVVVAYGKDEETMKKNEASGKWDVPTGRIEIRCNGAYAIPGFKMAPSVDGGKMKLKEFNAVVME